MTEQQPSDRINVAVIGAGRMGADHIRRLDTRISGARVSAVVDVDEGRAQAAVDGVPGAVCLSDPNDALARSDVDAVLVATPGFLHEDILLAALEADMPVLCEKPLTQEPESSWRIVQAEEKLGRKRIQVGFMRRFDAEYAALGDVFAAGDLGAPLMLHCAHRNPTTPPGFTNEMLITDSVVHEFDVIRYLTGEEIASVRIRTGRRNSFAPAQQHDPQHVLIETTGGLLADVEIFVNADFGYQVTTQAVFERGIVDIGRERGLQTAASGRWGGVVTPGFEERFGDAYDAEVQSWVDAAARGEIGGPSAWDGYATAACCAAGVRAQQSSEAVRVELNPKPEMYQS